MECLCFALVRFNKYHHGEAWQANYDPYLVSVIRDSLCYEPLSVIVTLQNLLFGSKSQGSSLDVFIELVCERKLRALSSLEHVDDDATKVKKRIRVVHFSA